MVPVENTTEGVVNPTLDSLTASNVKAVAEFNLPVHLFLYSASPVSEIRCIYSHPQPGSASAANTCRRICATPR